MTKLKREQSQRRGLEQQGERLDRERLAEKIEEGLPYVGFAYLLGSASGGMMPPYSDIDIAVYVDPQKEVTLDTYNEMANVVEKAIDSRREADIAVLNTAGCVFRFEALKGYRLFVRPDYLEDLAAFYSGTCRMYEAYMASMQRFYKLRQDLTESTKNDQRLTSNEHL